MNSIEYNNKDWKTYSLSPGSYTHDIRFINDLSDTVAAAQRDQHSGTLVFVSINNLAMIIASYSDALGEEVMDRLSHEVKTLIGSFGSVARLQKDLIGIVFPKITPEETSHKLEILHAFIQQFGCKYASAPVHLSEYMGSVDFPISATDGQQALEKAYIALSIAKKESSRYHMAYHDIGKRQVQAKHQMILASYLQHALLDNRLRLAFQPIINSKTGHIIYHESLLRIVSEDGKITSAGPFIPIAEAMGFIDEVDDRVLEMVISELKESPDIMLAFNISNLTVLNEKWQKKAQKLLSDPDIGSRVIIEMTETAMHGDLRQVSNFIAAMQSMGCQIAIDDFGVGYTSFRQMKVLPIDIVKIDGYFVKDIVDNSDNQLFVKTLLDFTRGLGLKAVAEFVETGEIAKLLMELKVDYMQGNYFCPAVNYRSWIKGEKSS